MPSVGPLVADVSSVACNLLVVADTCGCKLLLRRAVLYRAFLALLASAWRGVIPVGERVCSGFAVVGPCSGGSGASPLAWHAGYLLLICCSSSCMSSSSVMAAESHNSSWYGAAWDRPTSSAMLFSHLVGSPWDVTSWSVACSRTTR